MSERHFPCPACAARARLADPQLDALVDALMDAAYEKGRYLTASDEAVTAADAALYSYLLGKLGAR